MSTYQLTESDRAEAVLEILPPTLPIGRAPRWDDLTAAEKASATTSWLEKHPPHATRETVGARSGLTPSQIDYVGKAVYDAIAVLVPELVRDSMTELVGAVVEPRIAGALAESTTRASAVLAERAREDALANIKLCGRLEERIRVLEGCVEHDPAPVQQMEAAKLDSFERRLSRNADHLQRLEDRVRKLEGKG